MVGFGGYYLEIWKYKDEYGKVIIWFCDFFGLKYCGVENV